MLDAGLAVVAKRRINADTVASSHLVGDVKGKTCIITDDLTSTAGTICAAADILKKAGASKIYVVVSHCLLNDKGKRSFLKTTALNSSLPLMAYLSRMTLTAK